MDYVKKVWGIFLHKNKIDLNTRNIEMPIKPSIYYKVLPINLVIN